MNSALLTFAQDSRVPEIRVKCGCLTYQRFLRWMIFAPVELIPQV
jgi:hypothetical protein